MNEARILTQEELEARELELMVKKNLSWKLGEFQIGEERAYQANEIRTFHKAKLAVNGYMRYTKKRFLVQELGDQIVITRVSQEHGTFAERASVSRSRQEETFRSKPRKVEQKLPLRLVMAGTWFAALTTNQQEEFFSSKGITKQKWDNFSLEEKANWLESIGAKLV